jgi:hypothetical protein
MDPPSSREKSKKATGKATVLVNSFVLHVQGPRCTGLDSVYGCARNGEEWVVQGMDLASIWKYNPKVILVYCIYS